MILDSIFDFAKNSPALFTAIVTICIGLLSTVISLIEYFREKAFLDYFFVEDFQRKRSRSGLHPEFISLAAAIICSIIFIIEIALPILSSLSIIAKCIISTIVVSLVAMMASSIVFWLYHRDQKNIEKCWTNKELLKVSIYKGFLSFLKWLTICAVFSIGFILYYNAKHSVMLIVICIVACIYLYIKFDYEFSKKMFPYTIKFLISIEISGERYLIINSNEKQHYCVKYEEKDNSYTLYLDRIKIVSILQDEMLERVFIDKLIRRTINNTL